MKKKPKDFVYHGLGFPIVLDDVPMLQLDGEWVPDVDYNRIEDVMAIAVPLKPARLTGHEIRFLRMRLGCSPQAFAAIFDYTRQGIMKWEASGDAPSVMNWSTEKDLRLHVLAREKVRPEVFRKAYDLFRNLPERTGVYHLQTEDIRRPPKDKLTNQFVSRLQAALS